MTTQFVKERNIREILERLGMEEKQFTLYRVRYRPSPEQPIETEAVLTIERRSEKGFGYDIESRQGISWSVQPMSGEDIIKRFEQPDFLAEHE